MLVVDDEAQLRSSLRTLLEAEGFTVDVAADGEAALSLLAHVVPDAILLDLMMPGQSGRQVLRALRAEPRLARVPVLVMTAVTGLASPGELDGAEVIEKPFELERLLDRVALAVYRGRQARGTAPPPRAPTPRPEADERGVVVVALRDRDAASRLDQRLRARGYAVVVLTRVGGQLPRLARALTPRAVLVDVADPSERVFVDELRRDPVVAGIPVVVIERVANDEEVADVPPLDAALDAFLDLVP